MPSRSAVVYFTIWSYCWRIRPQSIVFVEKHRRQVRPGAVLPGRWPVQSGGADVLQPGHQLELEHVRAGEPDGRGVVGVGVLPVDLHVGAVPQHAEATSEAEQLLS